MTTLLLANERGKKRNKETKDLKITTLSNNSVKADFVRARVIDITMSLSVMINFKHAGEITVTWMTIEYPEQDPSSETKINSTSSQSVAPLTHLPLPL